jgi:hypothetical protein
MGHLTKFTSGAMRKSIRNFWHATPSDVLRSIGLGEGDWLEQLEKDEFMEVGVADVSCGLLLRSRSLGEHPIVVDAAAAGDPP